VAGEEARRGDVGGQEQDDEPDQDDDQVRREELRPEAAPGRPARLVGGVMTDGR
jgi:hypothetical protein